MKATTPRQNGVIIWRFAIDGKENIPPQNFDINLESFGTNAFYILESWHFIGGFKATQNGEGFVLHFVLSVLGRKLFNMCLWRGHIYQNILINDYADIALTTNCFAPN